MAISILRLDMRAPDFSPASAADLYAAALEMAGFADEKGFDSIVVSEHHGTDDGFLPSPIAMMGALAGRTRRIRISASALLLPLYDPVKLAEDLAVLDLASGGRVNLTAGLGYRPEEYEMLGRDWERRGAIMDENLDVLLLAWSGEPFEWNGRTVRVTPKPITQPKPPVWVGGMGRNAARRAGRLGLPFQPGVDTPEVLELFRAESRRHGVENPIVLPPGSGEMIWVSEDPDREWSRIGRHLLHDAVTYASWQPASQRSAVHSDAQTVEQLRAEGRYRILTPEECVKRAEQRGPFADFLLFPLCGGTPPDLAWPGLTLYADRVLPQIERVQS